MPESTIIELSDPANRTSAAAMPTGRLILLSLLALPVAEIAAFWLVAGMTGFFPALVLLLAGSAAGVLILLGLGRRLLERIGRRPPHETQPNTAGTGTASSGGLAGSGFMVAGGILLAIPGFLTNIAGAALLIPSIQRRLAGSGIVRRAARDGVIELDADEWTRVRDRRIEHRKE